MDLNSVLDRLAPLRHGKAAYLLALACIAGAVVMAAAAQAMFEPAITFIFAAAVVISTAVFGLAAGLLSAAVGVLALDYFFIPPSFEFNLDRLTLRAAIELAALAAFTHLAERRLSQRIRRQRKQPLGIHGQLDGVVDGEAYGWVLDADRPRKPMLVTILVNQRPVAEAAAVYYRADVETLMGVPGSHGFYVDLRGRVAVNEEVLVEAALRNGQRLNNGPLTGMIPARGTVSGPAVLFMHIPKTAGIAFREAIAANYRESEIAYLYPTPPGFLIGDLKQLPLEQRRHFRFVVGHYQYGVHDDLPQESVYVTIVREPGARMWSHYSFLETTQPALLRERERVRALEELLEAKPHIHFDNPLVRHFGSVDEREFPAGAVNYELYQKALYYMRNGFSFIGHQEFSGDAYRQMSDRFGWSARPRLELVNVGIGRSADSEEKVKVRKAVERYNPWDWELYQEILKLFPYPRQ